MQRIYFVTIIFDKDTNERVTGFKQDFASRFGCKAALKLMPHITIKAPFRMDIAAHDQVIKWFQEMALPGPCFKTQLRDFGSFPKKDSPVIFINVLINEELRALQAGVIQSFKNAFPHLEIGGFEHDFKPHVTIAYRDLEPAAFREAWADYSQKHFEALVEVSAIQLFLHDGKGWQIIATRSLPG